MGNKTYILNSAGEPEFCPDIQKWGEWFQKNDAERILAQDISGQVKVSTVFLGLDHSFGPGKDPVLWETMIFNGVHDGYQDRYTSREAALEGHKEAVRKAFGGVTKS